MADTVHVIAVEDDAVEQGHGILRVKDTAPVSSHLGGIAHFRDDKYGLIWDASFFAYLEENFSQILELEEGVPAEWTGESVPDDTIVCRCERITAGEVRTEIRAGVVDMNILKATIRTGMGACGGKTCTELILRLYREEGIDLSQVTLPTNRPFVAEVPLSVFAGTDGGEERED